MYNLFIWAYSISSACVTCFTWLTLYWAFNEEILQSRRIFRYDANAKACLMISTIVWGMVPFIVIAYCIIVHDDNCYDDMVRRK